MDSLRLSFHPLYSSNLSFSQRKINGCCMVDVQEDPEGFVRSGDVEASPDADTPRACGVALLLCLLERGGNVVAHTLMSLASRLQVNAATPLQVHLARAVLQAQLGCMYCRLSGMSASSSSQHLGRLQGLLCWNCHIVGHALEKHEQP